MRIGNPHVTEEYLPKIIIGNDVKLKCDDLIINTDGKAYVNPINSLDTEIEVLIPTVNMQPADLKKNVKDINIKDKRDKTNNLDYEKEKDMSSKPNRLQKESQNQKNFSVKVINKSENYLKIGKSESVCNQFPKRKIEYVGETIPKHRGRD